MYFISAASSALGSAQPAQPAQALGIAVLVAVLMIVGMLVVVGMLMVVGMLVVVGMLDAVGMHIFVIVLVMLVSHLDSLLFPHFVSVPLRLYNSPRNLSKRRLSLRVHAQHTAQKAVFASLPGGCAARFFLFI